MWRSRDNTIKLPVQLGHLQKSFPPLWARVKRDRLIWVGQLTPSSLSRTYTVRLRYRLRRSPTVEVLDPPLEDREGERPPHLYPGKRLCLFRPGRYEWDGSMFLAETIIPWASEWLFNYEIWRATGEWCGGGEHPAMDDDAEAV